MKLVPLKIYTTFFVYSSYLEKDLNAIYREKTVNVWWFERSTCSQGLLELKFMLQLVLFHYSSKRKNNPKLTLDTFFVAVGEGKEEFLLVRIWTKTINVPPNNATWKCLSTVNNLQFKFAIVDKRVLSGYFSAVVWLVYLLTREDKFTEIFF